MSIRAQPTDTRWHTALTSTVMLTTAAALGLAVAITAAAQTQPTAPSSPTTADSLKSLFDALTGQAPSTVPPPTAAALAKAQQASRPIGPGLAALFAKGTVNGADLIGTLNAIRQTLRERKSAQALAVMVSTAENSVNNLGSGNPFSISTVTADAFAAAATTMLKQNASIVATRALDDYLQTMVDDPKALAAETITLPSGVGLSEAQGQRIVTMAALVVGARVTDKVLERTKKDLEGLRTDYSKLLDRREEAAKLLFAAIVERNKLQQAGATADAAAADAQRYLNSGLSPEELAFVDKDLSGLSVAQFSKDMAAQNLALGYLSRAKPEQYSAYRVEADDVVKRTRSYLRTMTGVAAFGALAINFTQAVAEVAREQQVGSLVQSLPLMRDFVVAAAPLASVTAETALTGVELSAGDSGVGGFFSSIFKRRKSFVFVAAGGKSQEMAGAKDVFGALKNDEAATLFTGALFRSDAPGLLLRVGECDRAEAGRMLDAAVDKSDREAFARSYFGGEASKAEDFSFMNAFESTAKPGSREQMLPLELLGEDHRLRSSDTTLALAKVQQQVSQNYGAWGDAQLMRLIFVNREGRARYATLYLGESQIRPVPSPESVYAYETAAEACKTLVLPKSAPAPAATAKKTVRPAKAPPKKDTKDAK